MNLYELTREFESAMANIVIDEEQKPFRIFRNLSVIIFPVTKR